MSKYAVYQDILYLCLIRRTIRMQFHPFYFDEPVLGPILVISHALEPLLRA